MNLGRIIESDCQNVPTPPDARCSDEAFALANPGLCSVQPRLIIKPSVALACELGSVQFKAFVVQNGAEQDVTNLAVFSSGNLNVAMVGAGSGNCTGLSAGEVTISATYQGNTAEARLTVLTGDTCCSAQTVALLVMVDTTRSMSLRFNGAYASKLDYAKAAATRFISEINGKKDQVGLATFHGGSTDLLHDLSFDVAAVSASVAGIAGSSDKTEFLDPVLSGVALLDLVTADRKVLVIISDGDDTLTGTFNTANDPLLPLASFKDSGGIVITLGVRAAGMGFAMLSTMASGGFFINAFDTTAANSLDLLSGIKGYVCAGNCTPTGDVTVAKGKINYTNFANWTVAGGTVDLCGNGFFDFLPGNGLYVDLSGTALPLFGQLLSKAVYSLVAGHTYSLTVKLAGNQRVNNAPYSVQVRIVPANGGPDLLSSKVTINDYRQGFQTYSFAVTAPVNMDVRLSVQEIEVPVGLDNRVGLLLDAVEFTDSTDLVTLLRDDFDGENLTYVPPRCGPGTYYYFRPDISAFGYAYGSNCYGAGCLDTPPGVQVPDPSPTTDIESGTPPPSHVWTSTKNACVSCDAGQINYPTASLPWSYSSSSYSTSGPNAGLISSVMRLNGDPAAVQFVTMKQASWGGWTPKAFTISGSADGFTWTLLLTETGVIWQGGETKEFQVLNSTAYQFYRLDVTAWEGVPTTTVPPFVLLQTDSLRGAAPAQVCADGTGTSTTSQGDADSRATIAATAAARLLLNCRIVYTSTKQYLAKCPFGTTGADVSRSATATSFQSQIEADGFALAQATADATAALSCAGSNNTQNIVIQPVTVDQPSAASPYPAVKFVTGLTGLVTKVTATIKGLTFSQPLTLQMILRGPDGTMVELMRSCGGLAAVSNLTITFDDAAAGSLPNGTILSSGTFKPTQYGVGNLVYPQPGPQPPYQAALSAFIGKNPLGAWSLWICQINGYGAATGAIANGFDLVITSA